MSVNGLAPVRLPVPSSESIFILLLGSYCSIGLWSTRSRNAESPLRSPLTAHCTNPMSMSRPMAVLPTLVRLER